jgi:acyl-CoA dehydrogenase
MDRCVEEHTTGKLTTEDDAFRRQASVRVSRIYPGSSEIMKEIIARSLGLDPRKKKA